VNPCGLNQNKYQCTIDQELADAGLKQTFLLRSPGGSTFLREG